MGRGGEGKGRRSGRQEGGQPLDEDHGADQAGEEAGNEDGPGAAPLGLWGKGWGRARGFQVWGFYAIYRASATVNGEAVPAKAPAPTGQEATAPV